MSVPPKPLFRCDKQCSEKTLSYWQLASVVMNEGDEAHTTNLCQKCFNKHLQAEGEKTLSNVQWRQVVEKKAYRGRMRTMMAKEQYLRGMWEHFSCKRSKAKKFRQLADEEKQAGIQGQWQQESPAREFLEQVKCCHDTDCNESLMKNGFTASKKGTWEEYKETFREKMKASKMGLRLEAFEWVAQDEARKVSIVHEIMFKSTDYVRRIIAPVGGQGGRLRQFPFGRLRLVGLWLKDHKVVVRNLWRKVRLETTEQAVDRANWGKC